MKILVCTDGSKESQKAVEEAARIADGCSVNEVSVIHVYESELDLPLWSDEYQPTKEDIDNFKKARVQDKEKSRKNLLEAAQIFEAKNVKVNSIFKEGRPAETIVDVATEEGFDMVILGRRGVSGLKKLFIGSVSNTVLQRVDTSVLIVQ